MNVKHRIFLSLALALLMVLGMVSVCAVKVEDNVTIETAFAAYIEKNFDKAARGQIRALALQKDLDADGNPELLLANGNEVFALRNTNGNVTRLGKGLSFEASIGSAAEIIAMQGREARFIKLPLTSGEKMHGFALLKVEFNKLVQIALCVAESGVGEDILVDQDKDGKFDTLIKNRWAHDVLNFPTESEYAWNPKSETFALVKSDVDVGKLPAEPQDVAKQYLSLLCIDNGKSKQVRGRLLEIDPKSQQFLPASTLKTLKPMLVDFGSLETSESIEKDGKTATVVAITSAGDTLTFAFSKQGDKWQIESLAFEKGKAPEKAPMPLSIADSDEAAFKACGSRYIESKSGQYVMLHATGDGVKSIELIRVSYGEDDSFEAVKTLGKLSAITKEKPFALQTLIPEGPPTLMLRFVDAEGATRACVVSWSGKTGEPLLIAVDPKTGKTI